MMRMAYGLLSAVLLCASTAATGQAGPPPVTDARGPGARLDAPARHEVIDKFSTELRNRYIFPDTAEKVVAKLKAELAAGSYAALDDPASFAARLTADVAGIAHDKHMRVISMDAPPPMPAAPVPRGDGGILRADRLAGGIGYIEVLGFPPPVAFKPALDRAMTGLSGSRALIIDIRRNGGGSPDGVAYLVSYLIAPNRPINTIVARTANTLAFTRQTSVSVTTPLSFTGIPVYVLTSKDTFSGGEEFAYDVQTLKRATLIGEVTGGGANPVGPVELGHGLVALIPFGRAENPITRTNWEGRGVKPDIAVPAAEAFRTAVEKAGGMPADDVDKASVARVFAPRSTPLAGTQEALRRIVAGYAAGALDPGVMAPDTATAVKQSLPQLHAQFAALGPLETMAFNGPDGFGGDEYRLHFAHGDVMMALVIDAQGKVVALSQPSPVPAPK